MAAATTTKTSPTFSSDLNYLINLGKVVPAIKEDTLKSAHQLITRANSMNDLGFMEYLHTDDQAVANYNLTVKVLDYDEGLYAHLLNKVSKLICDGKLSLGDRLCIVDPATGWVFDPLCPTFGANKVWLLGPQAICAVVNYVNLIDGSL